MADFERDQFIALYQEFLEKHDKAVSIAERLIIDPVLTRTGKQFLNTIIENMAEVIFRSEEALDTLKLHLTRIKEETNYIRKENMRDYFTSSLIPLAQRNIKELMDLHSDENLHEQVINPLMVSHVQIRIRGAKNENEVIISPETVQNMYLSVENDIGDYLNQMESLKSIHNQIERYGFNNGLIR